VALELAQGRDTDMAVLAPDMVVLDDWREAREFYRYIQRDRWKRDRKVAQYWLGLRGNDIPCCWIRWGDLSNLPRSLVGDVLALAAKDSSAQLGVISAAEGVGREI
jgi:hypothetical protein